MYELLRIGRRRGRRRRYDTTRLCNLIHTKNGEKKLLYALLTVGDTTYVAQPHRLWKKKPPRFHLSDDRTALPVPSSSSTANNNRHEKGKEKQQQRNLACCSKSLDIHPFAPEAAVVIVQAQAVAFDVGGIAAFIARGRILVFRVVETGAVEEEAGVAVTLRCKHVSILKKKKKLRVWYVMYKRPSGQREKKVKTYRLPIPSSLIPFPLRFLLGVVSLLVPPLLLFPTRPPIVFSFFGVAFGFLGVVLAERAGRGRSSESASAFKAAASFLMMRKRPSMES